MEPIDFIKRILPLLEADQVEAVFRQALNGSHLEIPGYQARNIYKAPPSIIIHTIEKDMVKRMAFEHTAMKALEKLDNEDLAGLLGLFKEGEYEKLDKIIEEYNEKRSKAKAEEKKQESDDGRPTEKKNDVRREELKKSRDKKEEKIKELRTQLDERIKDIDHYKKEYKRSQGENEKLADKNNELKKEIDRLGNILKEDQQREKDLREQIEGLLVYKHKFIEEKKRLPKVVVVYDGELPDEIDDLNYSQLDHISQLKEADSDCAMLWLIAVRLSYADRVFLNKSFEGKWRIYKSPDAALSDWRNK